MENNQEKKINQEIPGIKTYSTDMAKALLSNDASVIKIALAEQEKRSKALGKNIGQQKKSYLFFIVLGVILFLTGSVIIVLSQKYKLEQSLPPKIIRESVPVVSYDSVHIEDLTPTEKREDVIKKIQLATTKPIKQKEVRTSFCFIGFVVASCIFLITSSLFSVGVRSSM